MQLGRLGQHRVDAAESYPLGVDFALMRVFMFRLRTVRAKLIVLVALSSLATLAALPVLSWVMHRQLIAQISERVPQAIRNFRLELRQQQRAVSTSSRQASRTRELVEGLRLWNEAAVGTALEAVIDAHPNVAIAAFDELGDLVAARGFDAPPPSTDEVPGLAEGLSGLDEMEDLRDVLVHGCDGQLGSPPAYMVAQRARSDAGSLLACIPIDPTYFSEVATKLGVEIALVGPSGKRITGTARFPTELLQGAVIGDETHPTIVEDASSLWALSRFAPRSLRGKVGDFSIVMALDVSDVRKIVRQNLTFAAGVLTFTAIVALILGARLATTMSRALSRVNVALKQLEHQQYVHVEALKTGDELEDLATGFNSMVDGLKERDKLRSTFGKYMTEAVLEHLLAGKVQLGGETLTVSILFCDIRSFTTISEKMNAQELVGLLNEYFTEMVAIILDEGGVVDKYIGDAIMAVFGAPVPKPNDAVRAVRAALRMRAALVRFNGRLAARGIPDLRTGVGIHTGEVVAGNIGSEARMEYTVIGDAVNLASRLETATKELGVSLLLSEETHQLVKGVFNTRPVSEITVKGRVQPVMTYAVADL
ncbi:adenylate/guanylate cyclase domain-containing protein [Sorangium sp. So ce1014]|uniref:adenylate/guanylate cyclase domain-containing protein n=1 Tax=Sorangium sp. So ce1014 TaxID=3133326 RepID=UPI003F611A5E